VLHVAAAAEVRVKAPLLVVKLEAALPVRAIAPPLIVAPALPVISALKVLAPAKFWAPVLTKPTLLPSAV